jgi:hypothetical protein
VGQRLDVGRVDREHRVEQMGQADTVGLGDEAEQRAIAVEAPRSPFGDNLQGGLAVTVEELVVDAAGGVFVSERQRVRAMPVHGNDRDQRVGSDTPNGGATGQLLQTRHAHPPTAHAVAHPIDSWGQTYRTLKSGAIAERWLVS